MTRTTSRQPATDKQIAYIAALAFARQIPFKYVKPMTKGEASDAITTLLQTPVPPKSATPSAEAIEVGMYRNEAGEMFKVQESATGNLYAKKLVKIGGERLTEENEVVSFEFQYVAGAIKSLTSAMRLSLDEAKAFGIKYGVCCVCGIRLKDATSVANGIGPICAGRL